SVRRTTRKGRSHTSFVETSPTAAISGGPSPSGRGRLTLISQRHFDPGKQRQPLGYPQAETFDDRRAAVAAHFRPKSGEAEFDRGRVAGKYLDQDRRSGRPDDPHDRGKEANAKCRPGP